MSEEILQVLKMVEAKTITAEEGARLIEALKGENARPKASGPNAPSWMSDFWNDWVPPPIPPPMGGRTIHVHVERTDGGNADFDVRLPIGLARFALRHIPREARWEMRHQGWDLDRVLDDIGRGAVGRIVDLQTARFKVVVSIE